MNDTNITKVGVGVLIVRGQEVLLGKRKNAHGEGQYACPGGHLEYMESFSECALREISEEVGVNVKNVRFLYLKNMREYAPKHYCHVHMVAEWASGEPQLLEPDKCESWEWFDINKLPSPIFATVPLAVEAIKTQKNFWD